MPATTLREPAAQIRERRSYPRVSVALPLVLSRGEAGNRIEGVTRDVCCQGFSFLAAEAIPLAEPLDGEIIIPGDPRVSVPEKDLHLRFRARVVRVEPIRAEPIRIGPTRLEPQRREVGFNIACRIEDDGVTCLGIDRAPL